MHAAISTQTGWPRRGAPIEARIKIALVLSHLGAGGAERVASSLARHWAPDHDVTIITIGAQSDDLYPLAAGVKRIALDLERPSANVAEAAWQAARRVVALRRALASASPDVAVSFTDRVNVLALLAASGTRIPVFVSERTDPRQRDIGIWAVLRRVLYPRAAGVVVQTEGVASWARAFCPRVHVIPNFVERPRELAQPGRSEGPRAIVAMGRLVPEKGFDLLVEAFARVAAHRPEWSLVLVGEGPERQRLESVARARAIEGRVVLAGHRLDPEAFLARAQIFALTSRFEGFPNALLEAMACGLAAVSFDCPSGPAEIIRDGEDGLLLPPGDVPALAAALASLMDSAAERERLGGNAREVASRFSPDAVLPRWALVLGEALQRRAA